MGRPRIIVDVFKLPQRQSTGHLFFCHTRSYSLSCPVCVPSCTFPNHGGVTGLFVLHSIMNLILEERLEVVTNDIPIC